MPGIGEVNAGITVSERDEAVRKYREEVEKRGYEELSTEKRILARFYMKKGVLQLNVGDSDLEKITKAIGPIPKKGITVNLPSSYPGGMTYEGVRKIEQLKLPNNGEPEKLEGMVYGIDVGRWYVP
jgi:hypothetical protein